jgi:hypothetical protein
LSVVAPFPRIGDRHPIATFDRKELSRILDLYGRMVAAGHWRDYALRPEVRIEKRPALRSKQGAFALVGEHGVVLKRGHELAGVLAPLERRLLRLID